MKIIKIILKYKRRTVILLLNISKIFSSPMLSIKKSYAIVQMVIYKVNLNTPVRLIV